MHMRRLFISLFVLSALVATPTRSLRADSWGVRNEIFDAIQQEPNFGPYEIEIDARMGNVVLFGTVTSERARERAGEIARGMNGVKSVSNQLTVGSVSGAVSHAGSHDIAKAVRDSILSQEGLGSYELNVRTRGSEVVLSGAVKNAEDSAAIERAARSVEGVTSVVNELALQSHPSDAEITQAVLQALKDERNISLEGLNVATQNGVVTIHGARSDHRTRDQILSIVLGVPGVRDVRSELQ